MGYQHTSSNDNVMPIAASTNEPESDRQLFDAVMRAAADLQRAMNVAVQAGLLVEPAFQTAEFRSTSVETATAAYQINLQILRKLL